MNLTQKIPYKWKMQGWTKNKDKVMCVAYIDSRDVQDLLDKEVGADKWSDNTEFISQWQDMVEYKCTITIGNVSKSDVGSFKIEDYNHEMAHKGAASDAFKRAAVKWGIGRFLYDLSIVYLTKDEYEAHKYDLTAFINNKNSRNTLTEAKVIFHGVDTYESLKKELEAITSPEGLGVIATRITAIKKTLTNDQLEDLRKIHNSILSPQPNGSNEQ